MSSPGKGEQPGAEDLFRNDPDRAQSLIATGEAMLGSLPSLTHAGGGEIIHSQLSDKEQEDRLVVALSARALIAIGQISRETNRPE